MFDLIKNWYYRQFADPRATVLALMVIFIVIILYFFMSLLAPIFVAIVLAYLLDLIVVFLNARLKINRGFAVFVVFVFFMLSFIFLLVIIIPAIKEQIIKLTAEMPNIINEDKLKSILLSMQTNYHLVISQENALAIVDIIKAKFTEAGHFFLQYAFDSLLSIVTLCVYAILVPLMTLFMLKDKYLLIYNIKKLLPKNLGLVSELNYIMHGKIKNYIVGKIFEFLIITALTYVELYYFKVNYALLLSVIVGITVFVPYVGVIIAVIPVVCVAVSQYGLSPTFYYLMVVFFVTQILDGNVLVPILFAGAVDLHPLLILISVLIFGGLLGFWGVFFAIPLASLVKAIIEVWPSHSET